MTNQILSTIISVLLATNFAYASALSYKESVTNGKYERTSNGIFSVVFLPFMYVGKALYGIIKLFTGIFFNKKKSAAVDKIFAGLVSGLLTIIFASVLRFGFGAASFMGGEDISIFARIAIFFKNTILQVIYYGIIFGLFGGDNCRLQNTPIGDLMDAIDDKLDAIGDADFITGVNDAVDFAKEEYAKDKKAGKVTKTKILPYVKAIATKSLSTVTETVRGLTSLLVDVKNIVAFSITVIFMLLYSAFKALAGVSADADVSEIISSPVDILKEQVLNFIITMVIIAVIKLIIKLIMLAVPKKVSDGYYSMNASLNKSVMSKLNGYSKHSYDTDDYAKAYSFRARMAKAEGGFNKK